MPGMRVSEEDGCLSVTRIKGCWGDQTGWHLVCIKNCEEYLGHRVVFKNQLEKQGRMWSYGREIL